MKLVTRVPFQLLVACVVLFHAPAWAQENPYTYVKMSLVVPWTLYFVFLAGVLIPFLLIIYLAWSNHLSKQGEQDPRQ